jgi:hypothetical protein
LIDSTAQSLCIALRIVRQPKRNKYNWPDNFCPIFLMGFRNF